MTEEGEKGQQTWSEQLRIFLKLGIGQRVRMLGDYAQLVNRCLEEQLTIVEKSYGDEIQKSSGKQKRELQATLGYSRNLLRRDFPDILWSSVFLFLYLRMEDTLTMVCKKAKEISGSKLELSDVRGMGLVQRKTYLKKLGIRLPEIEEWPEIDTYNAIRNAIMHNNAKIKDKDLDKVKNYASKGTGVVIDIHNRIHLSPEFINRAADCISSFLEETLARWDAWEKELKSSRG